MHHRAPTLRLFAHLVHQVWPRHAFGETWKVFHLRRRHELSSRHTAGLESLKHERSQIRPPRVDGRGVPRRSRPYDDAVLHLIDAVRVTRARRPRSRPRPRPRPRPSPSTAASCRTPSLSPSSARIPLIAHHRRSPRRRRHHRRHQSNHLARTPSRRAVASRARRGDDRIRFDRDRIRFEGGGA